MSESVESNIDSLEIQSIKEVDIWKECDESIRMFLKDFGPNEIFHDGEFEVSDGSLKWDTHGTIVNYEKIKKRTPNIYSNSWPFQVQQGTLGDCWLISVLMTIARRKELIEKLLPVNEYSLKYGIFPVRLFFEGQWQMVIVDGHFPSYENGIICFAKIHFNNLWPCILEKAVAKLLGGYHKIHKGRSPITAFEYLTGASSDMFVLRNETDLDTLWQKLNDSLSSGFLLTANTYGDLEVYENKGIKPHHVYSILDVCLHDGHRLILIGTTHSSTEFNRKWPELPVYNNEIIEKFTKLEKKIANEKLFWMDIDEFRQLFEMVTVCKYREGWNELRINTEEIIGKTKDLRIHVKQRCQLTIEITDREIFCVDDDDYYNYHWSPNTIGFINFHQTTSDNRIGELVMSSKIHIKFTVQDKKRETDTVYLDPGFYLIKLITIPIEISRKLDWVIRSPTVENISYDLVPFQPIDNMSFQTMVMKYGIIEREIENGIIIRELTENCYSILMVDNSTEKTISINATFSTTSEFVISKYILNENYLKLYRSKDEIYYNIPPKSRKILGTVYDIIIIPNLKFAKSKCCEFTIKLFKEEVPPKKKFSFFKKTKEEVIRRTKNDGLLYPSIPLME